MHAGAACSSNPHATPSLPRLEASPPARSPPRASARPQQKDWLASHWHGFMSPAQLSRSRNTGVPAELLASVGKAITSMPADFSPHRQIKKVYEQRRAIVESGEGAGGERTSC